ncbi:unnamed protein product, partial [Symbiodinium microadriaticum]
MQCAILVLCLAEELQSISAWELQTRRITTWSLPTSTSSAVIRTAREESTKIMSIRFAQRDAVKNDLKQDRRVYLDRLVASQRDRDERWARRLQKSPFAVDLVAEDQRIAEENRVREIVEKRRAKSAAARSREAHSRIFKRATVESDELDQLRKEKRQLLTNEKQLKALRDVERSNARTLQILQARQQKQQELRKLRQMRLGIEDENDSP